MSNNDANASDVTLLFLHGVGTGDKESKWLVALNAALQRLGYPELPSSRVLAPKYPHGLDGVDGDYAVPPITLASVGGDEAKHHRRRFERRLSAMEVRLGHHEGGSGYPLAAYVVGTALDLAPQLQQARNYVAKSDIRGYVLGRVLAVVPPRGKVIIVGHSLGSVIAADLVRRLPADVEVVGVVTIGSPLAHPEFDTAELRENLTDPPTNVAWWVNFWDAADPVTARRGISSSLPWLLDRRVSSRAIGVKAHAAVTYLGAPSVADAIGFALFGSRSREIVAADDSASAALTTAEVLTILALRYAHLTQDRLDGDVRDRFSGALRNVQADAVERLLVANEQSGRSTPARIARLRFDLDDPNSALPVPGQLVGITREEAVVPLIVLALGNVIRPFEISLPKKTSAEALRDLTAEMGLTSDYATKVRDAIHAAREELSDSPQLKWLKWGALGVGVVALTVVSGGLALAAAPGLAGAAAITSALAAFGPGGMIGGLLTAGSLATVGGGGIAVGLASSGTTAETVEAVITSQLSAAILRERLGLAQDPTFWDTLNETATLTRRDYERVDEFSDEGAASVKELRRKIRTTEKALNYLVTHGLYPGADATSAREQSDSVTAT